MTETREEGKGSRLFYFGTHEEVRLGDRVRIKRWLGRDLFGVVCYIPGLSPVHPDLEQVEVGISEWAILLDNELVMRTLYQPEALQPRKNVVLISRGAAVNFTPDNRLG